MKKLIICCDGTWQNSDGGVPEEPTNITRVCRALKATTASGIPQIVYYQAGVGTSGAIDKYIGGGTGRMLPENVREAYGFLAHNYAPGDSIHLFGFSRGAYTARSICGLIMRLGVLTKRGMDSFYPIYTQWLENGLSDDMYVSSIRGNAETAHYPVPVSTIGCFDTVGALGVPSLPIPGLRSVIAGVNTRRYQFLDTQLRTGVQNAFHALALDERRAPFTPTMWRAAAGGTVLKQCWFAGVHTNVGGGYQDQEIADLTLAWMISMCSPFLEFDGGYLARIVENHGNGEEWARGKVYDSSTGFHRLAGSKTRTPGEYGEGCMETVHCSVRVRKRLVEGYTCEALAGWEWSEAERCWVKGALRLPEEPLHEQEKILAGREIVEEMLVAAETQANM